MKNCVGLQKCSYSSEKGADLTVFSFFGANTVCVFSASRNNLVYGVSEDLSQQMNIRMQ